MDKLAIVTGATSGIGLETCIGLAIQGFHVVMVGRNPAKSEAARKRVWQAAPDAKLDVLLADFASLQDVRALAATIFDRYPRIDVLVNNAGMFDVKREISKDGFEMTWAVNHLAPFLLTNLLLDRIKYFHSARILNVASTAHQRGWIDWDDLQKTKNYKWLEAYSQSKLANILFTRELARRLAGTGVTANSLHPGIVATNIAARNWISGLFMKLGRPFLISAKKGAETSIHLASSPEVDGVTGLYFDKCHPIDPRPQAQNDDDAKRLWDISAQMVGL
jgi:NAD(P)-dependent dehydrogenase (short-subunit alcohol dehydrogenase family)